MSLSVALVTTAVAEAPLDAERRHRVSAVFGAGAALSAGRNGGGHAPGLAERVGFEATFSDVSAFSFDLEHSRQAIVDARVWFPGVDVPADALRGWRDWFVLDVGPRIGADVRPGGSGAPVWAVPWMRFGLVIAVARSRAEAPSLEGATVIVTNTVSPGLSLGAGVAVRVRDWLTLNPGFKAQVVVAVDPAEVVGGDSAVAAEWRFLPGLDVGFDF